jgi:hypothetical protein
MVASRTECTRGKTSESTVHAGRGGSDYLRDSFAAAKAHHLADRSTLSRAGSKKREIRSQTARKPERDDIARSALAMRSQAKQFANGGKLRARKLI